MSNLPPGFEWDDQPTAPTSAGAAPAAAPPLPPGFEYEHSAKPAEKWDRATILPFQKNQATGQVRLAWPGLAKDLADAIMLPGRTAKGEVEPTMPDIINAAGFLAGGVAPARSAQVLNEAGKVLPKPVARALRSDGVAPEGVSGKLAEIGPDAVLADIGPNLQAQAGAVATTPGAGQKIVTDALGERKSGAPERLRNELDTTLGAAPVPAQVQAGLKEQRGRLSPEYEAVLGTAGPVDTTALAVGLEQSASALRGEAQAAVQRVRKMLDRNPKPAEDPAAAISAAAPEKQAEMLRRHLAGEVLTAQTVLDDSPRTLFEVRKAIDGLIGSTSDSNVQRVLSETRKQVDALLGEAAPGIKDVDAKYSGLKRESTAFERGQTVLGDGRETPRPAELRAEVNKANAPYGGEYGPSNEGARLSQGARAEIDRIVGTNLNDRAALNSLLKGEGDWNYDRLTTLFGKEKTDRLYKVLEGERIMAETENRALAGSKTAAVQAAQAETVPSRSGPGVMEAAGNLRIGTAARTAGQKVLGSYYDHRQAVQNEELARALTSSGPLRAGTRGAYRPVSPLIDAIMRPDKRDER